METELNYNRLFISYIDSHVDNMFLFSQFARFGDCKGDFNKHRNVGYTKFAFVTYNNQSDAANALNEMNGKRFGSYCINVKYSELTERDRQEMRREEERKQRIEEERRRREEERKRIREEQRRQRLELLRKEREEARKREIERRKEEQKNV